MSSLRAWNPGFRSFSKDEHFTAEELFDRVRKSSNDISRATVYRTLALLVEADLLREIDLGENQTTYDPNFLDKPAHNHLVCIDCGRVVEFEDAHIDLLNDCVTRAGSASGPSARRSRSRQAASSSASTAAART